HARNFSPLLSLNGTPLSCTLRPGAWLTISKRAPGCACSTGRQPWGRCRAQTWHARMRAIRASKDSLARGVAIAAVALIRAILVHPDALFGAAVVKSQAGMSVLVFPSQAMAGRNR